MSDSACIGANVTAYSEDSKNSNPVPMSMPATSPCHGRFHQVRPMCSSSHTPSTFAVSSGHAPASDQDSSGTFQV